MFSQTNFNIHKYGQKFCLNDVVTQCEISTNPSSYYKDIKDKIKYKKNFYIRKDVLINILTKSKAAKAKELLDLLNKDAESDQEESNQIINFVDNGNNTIHFNTNIVKYVYVKQQVYFKAKEIAKTLGYLDTEQPIKNYIDPLDKITVNQIMGPVNYTGSYKTNEQLKIEQLLADEDAKTIFINESGLYSLILASKKPEAKKFKHWVTSEVLPAIRQYGSYSLTNKLSYSIDKIDNYKDHDVVYILNVKNNIYKFGASQTKFEPCGSLEPDQSYKIDKRLKNHRDKLQFNHIVKLYKVDNRSVALACEDKIKKLAKKIKISSDYNNGLEFFETNTNYNIDSVIQYIDEIINETNNEYKNKLTEIVPLHDVNNLTNLCKKMEHYINETLKIKEQHLMMSKIVQQLDLIQKQMELNKQKELFYQEQQRELNNRIKELEDKNREPSLIQKLIDAKIIGNKIEVNITEEINEKTLNGTKKVITQAKITDNNSSKSCVDCGCDIYHTSIRCAKCENKKRLIDSLANNSRPSLSQLEADLAELKSYVQVGKKYGVSDNCIRKWMNKYKYKSLI
jgi:prophage antirepressor-like protein